MLSPEYTFSSSSSVFSLSISFALADLIGLLRLLAYFFVLSWWRLSFIILMFLFMEKAFSIPFWLSQTYYRLTLILLYGATYYGNNFVYRSAAAFSAAEEVRGGGSSNM